MKKFLMDFANEFDDTDASEIQADTKFHELEEWSSVTRMGVIAMVRTLYGKTVTGSDIRICVTVRDLYNLVMSK